MADRPIIVHTQEDVFAALEAASGLNLQLSLQSAPNAVFYAGSLYLLQMYDQAKRRYPAVHARFAIDCGDTGAEAIIAMQAGHRYIISTAPDELRGKLVSIAAQMGAVMLPKAPMGLDLQHSPNALAACREWLLADVSGHEG